MICRYCGYESSLRADYCGNCGAKLRQEKPKKWILPVAAVCLVLAVVLAGGLIFGKTVREKAEICQVLPMKEGVVAALYTDGTVRVAGHDALSQGTAQWEQVQKIYDHSQCSWESGSSHYERNLLGLTQAGTVLSTGEDLSHWTDVKEIYVLWDGIAAVTHGGRVLLQGDWEDETFLNTMAGLRDVQMLAVRDETWGWVTKTGDVGFAFSSGYYYEIPEAAYWKNVTELRASDHGMYVLMADGTVGGQFDETYSGLTGAAQVVDFEDWLFGVSPEGNLLTNNGGNVHPNAGDLRVTNPQDPYDTGGWEIRQFTQVKEIVPFGGLVLLNEDGTVQFLGEYPNWDFDSWYDIRKVCGTYDTDWNYRYLYGIRSDGSVIRNRYDNHELDQTVTDQYRGWKLQDIFCLDGGAVGLTVDGKLVGDGIYENLDFSVFDR